MIQSKPATCDPIVTRAAFATFSTSWIRAPNGRGRVRCQADIRRRCLSQSRAGNQPEKGYREEGDS